MPKTHVVFLYGWAGSEATFGKLPKLLLEEGYSVKELHLGKYTTGDDNLSIDDYAIALEKAVQGNEFNIPFDIVIHSTGALVVRSWLSHYYKPKQKSPIRKFIMAAPANNGSRLASWGKKIPWDWGNKVLDALKLASPYTWKLNWEWLTTQRHSNMKGLEIYHLQGTKNDIAFPWMMDVADNLFGIDIPVFEEEGSDNTIRFCAANLNMKGVRLSKGQKMPDADIHEIKGIPVYLFKNRSHFGDVHGILGSISIKTNPVFKVIDKVLKSESPPPDKEHTFPKYMMLDIRVVDQLGNQHHDFIPRFYFGKESDKKHIEILHRAENNEIDCYYLKYNNLSKVSKFGFRIEGNKIGNVEYFPSEYVDLHWPQKGIRFLKEGKTHFVEVVVTKIVEKEAFSFSQP